MKLQQYQQICAHMASYNLVELSDMYTDVSYNTLVSIHSQKYQLEMRKKQPELKPRKQEFHKRYERGETIVDIAEDQSLAPCLMAQLLIECHFGRKRPEYLKNPELLADTDPRLCSEIKQCNSVDVVYSPFVEKIKHATGLEYEYILQEKLHNLGIPFLTEEDMRTRGYSHTPDCKLKMPVVIDGAAVNWIDSKASFGDEYYLAVNKTEQFERYVNRFGPGLVIYWFGFIENARTSPAELRRSGVLVLDDFPDDGKIQILGK